MDTNGGCGAVHSLAGLSPPKPIAAILTAGAARLGRVIDPADALDPVDAALARYGRVASRAMLRRQGLARHTVDNEIRRGGLVRILPRTHCRPWDADDIGTRERAALTCVGAPAALSHLTALRRWQLLPRAPESVHVTVPFGRNPRSTDALVVHRTRRFPPVVRLDRLVTVAAEAAIATSWPILDVRERRGPAIEAVRSRLVNPVGLRAAVERLPRLEGRRDLLHLVDLLEAGCESELEIWGYLGVFDVPGLRHATRQRVLRVRGETYRVDLAYDDERVAVELDGDRFHSTPAQRERDRRRDAALASIGWLTLRFSHARLHDDVAGCRRDTLATLARRRPAG